MRKKLLLRALLLALVIFIIGGIEAQAQKKTIILVRHAEKDISATADKVDPPLNDIGLERAKRLATTVKRYKPGAVYSTNFIRTRATATPTAVWRKKAVTIFDPKKLDELVASVMASKTKRFLIVAHNTTTPTLANLFIKEEKYKPLLETEYSKMWIIKIRNGKLKSVEVTDY
ncbi:MAG TPA: histidine phosphatase family protein [Pyrinomonadaceae bacterium]|nr:histidine phosphatase family protein [Chloracidobacterium sp.]MBP9934161.1 histidine phosphatase family protein [Pyrinomonadaceae bacterium]MBK7801641.1 histidine phosphatase family protein [Chloracidobacterium sp.]MBL0241951.1 histidine phosphatase family protein [Chloracidobacterium sp.]HQX55570.1 histidine phosphatase family protein [Pyrinomonadaceae bacterium]